MGRLPVPKWKVTPHGAFGYERRSPSDGACGTEGYPCKHPGVDLAAEPGDAVYAPEDGTLVAVVARDSGDLPRPWRGYGPGVVVLKGKSGRWHVLAHLEASDLKSRWPWASDAMSLVIDPARDLDAQLDKPWDVTDPLDRIPDKNPLNVTTGTILGRVGSARHVHWEVRKSKLGGRGNPATWANAFVWNHNPPPEASADVTSTEPTDALVLIVLGLLAAELVKGRR